MNEARIEALQTLLTFLVPPNVIRDRLGSFGWDCDRELVLLTAEHIRDVLDRYIGGELSESEVEGWADLIEGRDDIGVISDKVKQTIFRLANPALDMPLSTSYARYLRSMLYVDMNDPDV